MYVYVYVYGMEWMLCIWDCVYACLTVYRVYEDVLCMLLLYVCGVIDLYVLCVKDDSA